MNLNLLNELHLPLSGAIVLVAAEFSKMIEAKEISKGIGGTLVSVSRPLACPAPPSLTSPKPGMGNGHAVPPRDRLPAPLARRGALNAPAPLGAPLGAHPLRDPLHHVPARPQQQPDVRHRHQYGLPRARRRRGDGGNISLRVPLDDRPDSGASSKEARAIAAGFRIED